MGAQDEIEIRPVREEDAPILATLLNEIIARGGTTALDEPLTASALADTMLTGPDVLCCFVAVERGTGLLLGFQSLERHDQLPDDRGDIATFARVGLTQKGVGGALFAVRAEMAIERGRGRRGRNGYMSHETAAHHLAQPDWWYGADGACGRGGSR